MNLISEEIRTKIFKTNYISFDNKIYIKNAILKHDMYQQEYGTTVYVANEFQYVCINNKDLEIRIKISDLLYNKQRQSTKFYAEQNEYKRTIEFHPDLEFDREYHHKKTSLCNINSDSIEFIEDLDDKWVKALYL